MKQTTLFTILVFGVLFLYSFANKNNDSKSLDYSVIKIDSIKNWYVIYASRNDSVFKIVSLKKQTCQCDIISVGKQFHLELQERMENVLSKDGLKLIPMNYADITGLHFDPDTDVFVSKEKGIYGLYTSENLSGLCVLKK
jgi:hypothetical protein